MTDHASIARTIGAIDGLLTSAVIARDGVADLVSYIHENLTSPHDDHIKESLLEIAAGIEGALRGIK